MKPLRFRLLNSSLNPTSVWNLQPATRHMGETPAEQSPRAVQMDVGQPSCHVPDLCPQETLMYFSPRTLDTAGSYHLSCDLQNLLSKQESDLTRDRPDLSLGRLPWWFSSKESACQCRRHKFESWSGGFHIPWSSWTHALQLLSPWAHGHNKRTQHSTAREHPHSLQPEKSLHSEDPAQPRINKNKKRNYLRKKKKNQNPVLQTPGISNHEPGAPRESVHCRDTRCTGKPSLQI